jgi:hypothetical protein
MDLLSFKCMVNGVRMIDDQPGGTIRVNFTGRGHHLYSRSAAAKSTLFVDGLGCGENTETAPPVIVRADGLTGIQMDASKIYLRRWRAFTGRLFLQVDSQYWLIVDTAPGRSMESRFHTHADLEAGNDWASLKKDGEQMMMTFASLSGSVMQHSRGMPLSPREQTKIIRWMTKGNSRNSLHVAALNPGNEKLKVSLSKDDAGFAIKVSGKGVKSRTILLTPKLMLRD